MALDANIKAQLNQYLALLEGDIVLKISIGDDAVSSEMRNLIDEIASMSPRISVENAKLNRTPSFEVNRPNGASGITFAGVPLGHEFTSLVLALLQVSGRKPKIDDALIENIKNIKGNFNFETYVSLTCHNCPDVVQALNTMAALNPNITHTMIEGGAFQKEVEERQIMAVPNIYLNGDFFESGRVTLEEIIAKIDTGAAARDAEVLNAKDPYDVLILGGGPAGAAAAIYAARKGIRTGVVAERFGGQVMDTLGIENFIATKYTEGSKLAAQLEEHVKEYDVDIMNLQTAKSVRKNEMVEIELENGAILKTKALIVATGARWRNVNVPGEKEYKNKGVAYCPHCDGPLFKGKDVAVIGGGNSGIEAAIDLAGVVRHVTVLEFMPELKADAVLQERLYSLPNVTVYKNVQTKEITGTDVVNGISFIDRETQEEIHVKLDGVFVQIGLVPNTEFIGDLVERSRFGEIIVDGHGATNISGIFAAGDCTNSVYKQIIIAMGSGANAALGAFDYLIRN
ncbi:MAG: alkyl hydroperoxide reductase subunit F [Caulobacterales bacterium]|nr:alkyl hydroperoxide reductase subunit F [Caulobacterales bacterium]MCA0373813.1 alkyl hydroperoxide reductase subunit F [Pseudomonadota bacterium]